MDKPTSSKHNSSNRVPIIVAIAIAALVGFIGGAAGGLVANHTFGGLAFFGNTPMDLTDREVEREIVELIEEESATINVVERVTPAVVSVIVKKPLKDLRRDQLGLREFSFGSSAEEADLEKLIEISGGTGFFVTKEGLVVTNKHVVEDDAAVYTVVTNDGAEYPAQIVDKDPFFDIAVLRVTSKSEQEFDIVTFGDSDRVRIGQTVIAIGNTLSQYRNTVTKGVISGIDRNVSAYDFTFGAEVIEGAIQTDAAINPGNSGGPLINLFGEVIGVNTAISAEGEGIGFAIPINEVKQAVTDVEEVGRIVRPWLGVRFVMLTETFAKEEGLAIAQGAIILPGPRGEAGVVPESPAGIAGLQENDVILKIDGVNLTKDYSLSEAVRAHRPGDVLALTILRGEEMLQVQVTLAEFEE